VRYRAAVGVGEEAHSRQRHWCPWSKPVNVETWGHVPYPVVMAHAFAELRYGIVARQHETGFKCGFISAQTLYLAIGPSPSPAGRDCRWVCQNAGYAHEEVAIFSPPINTSQ
jgi:hypothetical protein